MGLLHVSGKLPTYPSPKPTLTITSPLGKMLALGRGRWAVSQKRIMIHKMLMYSYEEDITKIPWGRA